MTGLGWQDLVVALIVLCAVGYLVRRKLDPRRSAVPCGDCPGCATAPVAPAGNELVSIGVAADALARPRAPG
ncbi:MAG: FeoB-associated Cys-rich membrane protein [Gemmatimonadota bacterium]